MHINIVSRTAVRKKRLSQFRTYVKHNQLADIPKVSGKSYISSGAGRHRAIASYDHTVATCHSRSHNTTPSVLNLASAQEQVPQDLSQVNQD